MFPKNRLKDIINKYDGIVTTNLVEEKGIHRQYLNSLIKAGEIERISHGIYISPDAWEDMIYINQLKREKMIYSHETALYLHDLTDRDPLHYVVTVPQGYNSYKLKEKNFKVYSIKKEWFDLGIVAKETVFGNEVKTYDMERTICDIIRARNKIDATIIGESLKRYFSRKDKDLNKLMKYAKELKIENNLRTYMEVLL